MTKQTHSLSHLLTLVILVTALTLTGAAQSSIGNNPDHGPTLPTTCKVGQTYFLTVVQGGNQPGLYQCATVNTFSAVGGGTGTVTNIATTSPVGGGPITTTGTITCTTCATTTNGGALSGTAPVTISAAGAIACTTCVTSAASLTSNAIVLGGGSQASATNTAFTTDGAAVLTVGVAGGGNGVLALSGNTSGTATFTAPAIAGTRTNAVVATNTLQLPAGAVATPAYGFAADTNSGFYSRGGGLMNLSSGGVAILGFAAAGGNTLIINQTACMGWPTSGDATNANTTTLCGSGVVRTMQHGANQSGTNTAASSQSVQPGAGTGNTTPATWQVNGPAIGASGSAVQTQITRLAVNDFKALTSGVAATLLSIPLAADQTAGGTISWTARATDTVNHLNCSTSGEVAYAAENSASTFVTNTSILGTAATACTATVTDTCTFAVTSANPALLQATCTLVNMASPTSFNIVYTVDHHSDTNPTL